MEFAQRFELYACLQCGKCTGGCPVALRTPLNVRMLMREALIYGVDALLGRPEIWDCTTCKTCTLRCPRKLEPSEVLIALRAKLVESGRIPKNVIDALEATYVHGNPWGRARQKRTEWAKGLRVKEVTAGVMAEVLGFVCCAVAYDPRLQPIAQTLTKVMALSGVDFGILGTEESCCGNEIRRMGEEGLFEELREANKALIESSGAKEVVVLSPHCFNTLRNEYGLDGVKIVHYTEVLEELLKQGRLSLKGPLAKKVVYHDPCFLGKQNSVYEAPRKVLEIITGVSPLEFSRSRETSLCCEGGGGRMWVEGTGTGIRNSEIRVKEALEMGAEVIATACPFCLLTLEDALKTTGLEGKLEVKDILELLGEALGLEVDR